MRRHALIIIRTNDRQASHGVVQLGANGYSESQEKRVNDAIADTNRSGGDVARRKLESTGKDNVALFCVSQGRKIVGVGLHGPMRE